MNNTVGESPQISVIIPYYNVDTRLINNCIDSVLNQDFNDFEILLIDDGSDNEYQSDLKIIADKDSRIQLIHESNSGVSYARNTGINNAKGDYLVFVDADDMITPSFFSEAISILQTEKADFVIGGNFSTKTYDSIISSKGKLKYKVYEDSHTKQFLHHMMGDIYRFGKEGGFVGRGPVARLVRKSVVDNILFNTDLKVGEDIVWNIKVLDKCKRICVVDRIWYNYYKNPDSATQKYNPKMINQCEAFFTVLEKLIDLDEDILFISYIKLVLGFLTIVYRCQIGNKLCDNKRDKKRYIYKEYPWKYIADYRFIHNVNKKYKIKAIMYKYKLLFLFWDLKSLFTGIKRWRKKQ
jgi:Glycosyltransferases, probably involved in cell wall biogenesis